MVVQQYRYGDLVIQLQSSTSPNSWYPGKSSPVNFTLPSSLETVWGNFEILCLLAEEDPIPTTSIAAPNLKTIGFWNSTSKEAPGSVLFDIGLNSTVVSTTSFPALTSIAGSFQYFVSPAVTVLSGFPVLGQIDGSEGPNGLYINGSFNSLQLPALTFVNDTVYIDSTSPSFQCPSNITPKIVPYGLCVLCGYSPSNELPELPTNCNNGGAEPSGTVGPIPTGTAAASTAKSTGVKASGGSALKRSGNQLLNEADLRSLDLCGDDIGRVDILFVVDYLNVENYLRLLRCYDQRGGCYIKCCFKFKVLLLSLILLLEPDLKSY